ncbi:hypothetical protein GCM10010172_42160 [Paractinoplanes ferrugineus]|uniref:protein adenylyltransferase n=1 Tax=Paractinoplanes ferrugineus TaxID=113564 RepID=A0A919J244_9ACTN|nr:Fic family protein [Actinoplanes ferrugineus]GIE13376.1 hypothetical protein Afe05nite_52160 [Actinoplanes ferrugineus]
MDDRVGAVLSELAEEGYLVGLDRETLLSSLAHFYGELNSMHPFHEGNGRALRAFLRQLSAAAGFQLDWSELSKAENARPGAGGSAHQLAAAHI